MNRTLAACQSEYRKVTTTRMWWILLLAGSLYLGATSLGLAVLIGLNLGTGPAPFGPGTLYSLGVSQGYVFPLIIGALIMTNEYRYSTMAQTLQSEPRRGVVLGSKLAVAALVGAIFAVVMSGICIAAGASGLAVTGGHPDLSGTVWQNYALSLLALALWAAIGVGFGALVRNQIVAIIVIVGWMYLVEPLLRMALAYIPAVSGVSNFLPGTAAEAVAGGNSIYSVLGSTPPIAWWQGGLIMLGWVALFAVLARVTTLRRDLP